jgi:hypothetical protein
LLYFFITIPKPVNFASWRRRWCSMHVGSCSGGEFDGMNPWDLTLKI